MVQTSVSVAETEKKYIQQIEELNESYERYNPVKIAEHYQDEIDKIEFQLYGETTEHNDSINRQTSRKDTKTTPRWIENVSPLLSFILIAGSVVYITEPASRSSLFFGILFGAGLAKIYIELELMRWAGFGLIIRSRLIASNLRIVSIVVFAVMTQIYFDIFDLGMKSVSSADETINLLRYAASVIFIISPFIFYYRHNNNRANQLHILQLSLHRERNNLLFWIAEKSDDINSPKFQLAKEILNHTNKNGAADIAVRMLHPKLDKERRWSLFGFGGNALSGLEDKLEDLTNVIKRLEVREPKQDEDKQKTKGNDTDVGGTTDNK